MVLALDWGARRIGVAVGDLELHLAHPLRVLTPANREHEHELLAVLIDEWHPVALVVGVPARDDAQPHPLAARCRTFGRRLAQRFKLPVHWVNEELSSWAADQLLRQTQRHWRDRKARADAVAAQQILETFFERIASAS